MRVQAMVLDVTITERGSNPKKNGAPYQFRELSILDMEYPTKVLTVGVHENDWSECLPMKGKTIVLNLIFDGDRIRFGGVVKAAAASPLSKAA